MPDMSCRRNKTGEETVTIEKISRETPDLTQENIEKLLEIFPQVATEVSDNPLGASAPRRVERAIDFDALRELLGDVAEGGRERYQFTWPGKREAKAEARRPTRKTMRPCPEKSVDWDTTQNLYIEGDNLEALKIMRETYAGKVKLIYIDPPYNTGHDFVYYDDFSLAPDEYRDENGELDEDGNRLVKNVDSNGRFHSDWCSMMYPRLLLARDLLTDDGVIAISIDDNENDNLRMICNEIFGESNYLVSFVWQKRTSPDMRRVVSAAHEYILLYAKNARNRNAVNKIPYDENDLRRYKNPDNDPNGPWTSTDCTAQAGHGTAAQFYDMVTPSGRVVPLGDGLCWRYTQQKMNEEIAAGHIWFGSDGNGVPRKKTYLKDMEGKNAWSWLPNSEVGHTQEATKELKDLFQGMQPFDFPKPVRLLKRLIQICTNKDSLVLDFFSGSATTAEAVMRKNAEDGDNRRFVLVQLPQKVSGEVGNLCNVGEERIRRAGAKIRAEVEEANRQLELGVEPKTVPDLGFRVLRVGDSCLQDEYTAPVDYDQAQLDLFADNLVEGTGPLDLLFQVLPAFRIPYSAKITERELGGKACLEVINGDDRLIACFDEDVDAVALEAIAHEKPRYAVFRDASFANDAAVSNLEEIFKTFSPDTIRKVI